MNKIKFSNTTQVNSSKSIEDIFIECEQYRSQLIQYCSQYFDCEYEYAKDCVQEAYVALFENLNKGIEIHNYKAWLYKVVLNYKNKVIKDKIKHNEYDFIDNEDKDETLNSTFIYETDYIENMVTNIEIEQRAVMIIASLNEDEKTLYYEYYCKNENLSKIAEILGVSTTAIKKRHERLKKKLNYAIKDFEKY